MNCPQCGTENREGARFCQSCRYAFAPAAQPTPATAVVAPAIQPDEVQPRHSANGSATQPLPALRFEQLPEGAYIIGPAMEYQVEKVLSSTDLLNQYQVTTVQPMRVCPQCASGNNRAEDTFCTQCGHDLNHAMAAPQSFLIKEANNPAIFGVEANLANLSLQGSGLRLPGPSFTYRVGGSERHYLTLAVPAAWPAAIQPPQEVTQVLDWGISLGRGLQALHQQRIVFGPFSPQRVTLEGKQACWSDFSLCHIAAQDTHYIEDVRHLASWLYYLISGQQYQAHNTLPASLQPLFARALQGVPQPFESAADFVTDLENSLAEIHRPASIEFRVGRRSDVGVVRPHNEDSLLSLDLVWNNLSVSRPVGVFVVADGMGGHAGGEVASGLALQAMARSAVQDLLVPTTSGNSSSIPDYTEWMKGAILAVNTAVYERVKASRTDMGTTIVAALMVGDTAYLGHVGDSRAYLVNTQEIRQITTDHSLVERLVATGQITREEARTHDQRNVVYRTIGDKRTIEVDTNQISLHPGDRLLLCSDGLSGMIEDATIQRIVLTQPSAQAACDELVRAANLAGGEDNISVIIVQVEAS
jgi:serine/threonine protein phosphatase PrpC